MTTQPLPEHPDFLWRNPEPQAPRTTRRDRRRRRPRPGHRLLPGQEPRHHQRRRPGAGLAGRRQHGPQHHDHPLQLPVGRERGDLRARAQAVGGAARRSWTTTSCSASAASSTSRTPCRTSARACAGSTPTGSTASTREWLDPDEVAEVCPILNVSPDVRYPVLGATFQPRAGIAKHDHVAWALARRADAARRRPDPGLRGHRLPQGRRPGRRASRPPAGRIRAGRSALAAAGHSSVLARDGGLPAAAADPPAAGAGVRAAASRCTPPS